MWFHYSAAHILGLRCKPQSPQDRKRLLNEKTDTLDESENNKVFGRKQRWIYHDLQVGNTFLSRTHTKMLAIKKKMNTLDYIH